jgi:hypothetical protein
LPPVSGLKSKAHKKLKEVGGKLNEKKIKFDIGQFKDLQDCHWKNYQSL